MSRASGSRLPVVLIDGDSIVYRSGFAAQHRVIHAVIETAEGNVEPWQFEGRADRNKWLKDHEGAVILDEREELVVEPLSFALHTVKRQLQDLATLGKPQVFLSGKRCFREEIATVAPYKGNRDPANRPVHYQAIRDYMTDQHGAVVIEGREADDEISIRVAAGGDYIVASIDKDLDQIPGRHFDYKRKVEYAVDAIDAFRWFLIQCLAGDSCDNVPGCYKVGLTRAAKLIDSIAPWNDWWPEVVAEYEHSQRLKGCPYAGFPPAAVALETAQLVYLQKRPGELWMPPPGSPKIVEKWLSEDD